MNDINIRNVTHKDIEQLLDIYAYYVKNTAITFEYKIPTIEEFKSRIKSITKTHPFIVATINDEVVGYAYTSPYYGREAYNWDAEISVYIKKDMRGKSIGKKLYQTLEDISKKQNIVHLYACIAFIDKEDNYLSNHSYHFHKHLGYQLIGHFRHSGYKFNNWYDVVWMDKVINPIKQEMDSFIPYDKGE